MGLTRFGFRGLIFYVTMVLAFYASPYSNLFFLLLAFLTVLGLGGLLATRGNLRGVSVESLELRPTPTEAEVEVATRLRAHGAARFQIEVHLCLEGDRRVSGRVDVLDGVAALTLKGAPLPRGCHGVERAYLESSHPFGLLRATRSLEAPRELVVYPSPGNLMDGRSASEALDHLLGRSDPGAGDLQPSGLRDHREGDGVRGIHWRASARRDRLVVQEWEGGRGRGLEVSLDRRCSSAELEEALVTISGLVLLARTGKETFRLHSQGLSATFGEGHRPWSEVLRFLASAQPLAANEEAPPPTSPSVTRLPRSRVSGQGVPL